MAIDSESFRELTSIPARFWGAPATRHFNAFRVPDYFRCHGRVTFRIRGLQTSLTNTKDKLFWSGRLNL